MLPIPMRRLGVLVWNWLEMIEPMSDQTFARRNYKEISY